MGGHFAQQHLRAALCAWRRKRRTLSFGPFLRRKRSRTAPPLTAPAPGCMRSLHHCARTARAAARWLPHALRVTYCPRRNNKTARDYHRLPLHLSAGIFGRGALSGTDFHLFAPCAGRALGVWALKKGERQPGRAGRRTGRKTDRQRGRRGDSHDRRNAAAKRHGANWCGAAATPALPAHNRAGALSCRSGRRRVAPLPRYRAHLGSGACCGYCLPPTLRAMPPPATIPALLTTFHIAVVDNCRRRRRSLSMSGGREEVCDLSSLASHQQAGVIIWAFRAWLRYPINTFP